MTDAAAQQKSSMADEAGSDGIKSMNSAASDNNLMVLAEAATAQADEAGSVGLISTDSADADNLMVLAEAATARATSSRERTQSNTSLADGCLENLDNASAGWRATGLHLLDMSEDLASLICFRSPHIEPGAVTK